MTSRTVGYSALQHPLGTLGLVLIGLVTWAAGQLETRGRIACLPAQLVLAGVTMIGRLADALPPRIERRRVTPPAPAFRSRTVVWPRNPRRVDLFRSGPGRFQN